MLERTVQLARWLPAAAVLTAALAVWPAWQSAFHAPKDLALWGFAVIACAAAAVSSRMYAGTQAWRVPVALGCAWLFAVGLSSVTGEAPQPAVLAREAAAAFLFVGLAVVGVSLRPLVAGSALAGAVVASVCLLQLLGADPFAWVGFVRVSPGARLAVYGTLGNPDFAASVLTVTLVLSAASLLRRDLPPRQRGLLFAAAALQLLALAATRSFATVLALGAAGAAWAVAKRSSRAALVACVVAGVVALPLVGRSSTAVVEGRLYLWRVAAPHLLEHPLTGFGPGAFEVLWPAWEAQRFTPENARFAGLQDHAHNDWLERALEQGAVGVLALAALLLLSARAALRRARSSSLPESAAVFAALAALAARSFVDFPLARPADLCLFAVLCAAALGRSPEEPS